MHASRNGPRLLLYISFLSFIIIGVPGGALGVVWLQIQDAFHLGLDSLGVVLTISTIGRLVTAFTSGYWIAKMTTGRFLLTGALLGALGMLGFALAPIWPVLLVSEFVRGLGSGVIDAGVNTFVAPRYSTSRLNWLHACFGLGLTIGPTIVTITVIQMGQSWRWTYVLICILYAVLMAIFCLTLKRWGLATAPEDVNAPVKRVHLRDSLRMVMMWLSLALFFFYGGAEIGTGQLLNSLFVEGRSIDPTTAGFWISFYWGSFTVGRILIGVVADRIGSRRLIRVCMSGTVMGAVLIWWNPLPEASFVGLAVMGLSLAPIFPTLVAITPDRVGIAHTPNAIGFQIGFAGLGAALLVGLAGVIAEQAGLDIIAPFLVGVTLVTIALHEVIMMREVRLQPESLAS